MVSPPHKMSASPPTPRSAAPPLGRDTDAILGAWGYDERAIAGLRESGVIR